MTVNTPSSGAPATPPTGPSDERVHLSVPAELGYVRLIRLAAAAYGAGLGLDVDELEDFRIAVNELASLLIEVADGPHLDVELRHADSHIHVVGRCVAESAPVADPITAQILDAVTASHAAGHDDGAAWLRFVVSTPAHDE